MRIANAAVGLVLRSPAHRLLSSSLALVRYEGRRSGRVVTTPVQYASSDADVVVLAGRADGKTWWRNFAEEHPVEVLVRGRWVALRAVAVHGATDPGVARPLLVAYLARFPSARRALPGTTDDERLAGAVLVWCRPQ